MSVREIPPGTWQTFLDSFSRQHHGWLVSITRGSDHLANDEPLDFARTENHAIVVSAGEHLWRVEYPNRVSVTAAGPEDTAIGHVAITGGGGETLTIRFREVVVPEVVDGVVP